MAECAQIIDTKPTVRSEIFWRFALADGHSVSSKIWCRLHCGFPYFCRPYLSDLLAQASALVSCHAHIATTHATARCSFSPLHVKITQIRGARR